MPEWMNHEWACQEKLPFGFHKFFNRLKIYSITPQQSASYYIGFIKKRAVMKYTMFDLLSTTKEKEEWNVWYSWLRRNCFSFEQLKNDYDDKKIARIESVEHYIVNTMVKYAVTSKKRFV